MKVCGMDWDYNVCDWVVSGVLRKATGGSVYSAAPCNSEPEQNSLLPRQINT